VRVLLPLVAGLFPQPGQQQSLDLGIACAGMPAPEILAHNVLRQLVEIQGGAHTGKDCRIANRLHRTILPRNAAWILCADAEDEGLLSLA